MCTPKGLERSTTGGVELKSVKTLADHRIAMDQFRQMVQPALGQAMGSVLGSLVVFAAIFLLVLLVVLPLYFILRQRGPGRTGITFQMGSTPIASGQGLPNRDPLGRPDNWQPQPTGQPWEDRREQLLHNLDTVERGVSRFYVVLLCLIMAGLTGVAVAFYLKVPDDGNRDFLLMYGGIVYLIGMLWAASQLFSVMRRLSPPPDVLSGMKSRINVSFQTSPQVQFIDNQALDRAQQHLDSGGSLEEACALMDSKYRSMNSVMQGVFKKAVEVALEQRRKPQS